MAETLRAVKGQIRQRWFDSLSHWLAGGTMQGHLVYTNDPAIDYNKFLRQLYGETLTYLGQNEFKLKCRPAFISAERAGELKTTEEVRKYMADAVDSHEILAGGADVRHFDYRPLFFIENLDALIARVDNIAELKRLGRHEWGGLQSHFKEASDTGMFNVVLTAADYGNSVFTDGRAGPFLIYLAHELKK
ncbi:MAG: hypothetical protein HY438_02095 [DPANN group archaeon]|nr:hypothetical protein [DPANN group archaeon]